MIITGIAKCISFSLRQPNVICTRCFAQQFARTGYNWNLLLTRINNTQSPLRRDLLTGEWHSLFRQILRNGCYKNSDGKRNSRIAADVRQPDAPVPWLEPQPSFETYLGSYGSFLYRARPHGRLNGASLTARQQFDVLTSGIYPVSFSVSKNMTSPLLTNALGGTALNEAANRYSSSSGVTEPPPSHPDFFPEGKPHWNQLQHVALVLSKTLPLFFRERGDYTIYNKEVFFENKIHNITTKGLKNLWFNFGTYHIMGRMGYAFIDLVVLNVSPIIDDGSVRVRFRVVTVNYAAAIFITMQGRWNEDYLLKNGTWRDAYATFYVGDDGLVYHLVVDQVIQDELKDKSKNPFVRLLKLLGLTPAGTANPATSFQKTRPHVGTNTSGR